MCCWLSLLVELGGEQRFRFFEVYRVLLVMIGDFGGMFSFTSRPFEDCSTICSRVLKQNSSLGGSLYSNT